MTSNVPSVTLNNGVEMPILGFGVFQAPDPAECERSVRDAIDVGYPRSQRAGAVMMDTRSTQGMKRLCLLGAVALSVLPIHPLLAQQTPAPPTETIKTAATHTPTEQRIIDLSKTKWDWMADKRVDSLATLFDDRAMFTHMGGTWGKAVELATIKSGGIWYKKASIYAVDVRVFGNTAIVLEDLDLEAVVGGRTVSSPFMVTEVYNRQAGKWRLAQLTFSRLVRPVKANAGSN